MDYRDILFVLFGLLVVFLIRKYAREVKEEILRLKEFLQLLSRIRDEQQNK